MPGGGSSNNNAKTPLALIAWLGITVLLILTAVLTSNNLTVMVRMAMIAILTSFIIGVIIALIIAPRVGLALVIVFIILLLIAWHYTGVSPIRVLTTIGWYLWHVVNTLAALIKAWWVG